MKISGICGSLRDNSWNRTLLSIILESLNEKMKWNAKIENINDIPLYNQDVEDIGMPSSVKTLRNNVQESDLIIFSTPTYNSSYSGVIKNIIDWLSRPPNCLNKKYGLVICATPGISGGLLSYTNLNQIIFHLGMKIMNQPKILVPNIENKISSNGEIIDTKLKKTLSDSINVLTKNLDSQIPFESL